MGTAEVIGGGSYMTSRVAVYLAGMLALGTSTACGESGRVKVQLSPAPASVQALREVGVHAAALNELEPIAAEQFEMKILSAYLAEDIDAVTMNNVGAVQRIWVNPSCPSADGCRDSDVDYFDLSDPREANRALNEQAKEIETGTYRYVRVQFCIGDAQGNIVRYKTAGMSSPVEARYGGCAVTSERIEPPVELGAGDTITIALAYDLTKQPLYYVEGSPTCGAADTQTPCLGGITLTPQIVR
jgi:hypothetical protein